MTAFSWRQVAHCLLVVVGFAIGAITFTSFTVGFLLLLAAHKILPNSRHGNCWSFSVPRWLLRGGGLMVRFAEDVRFLKVFPIPHVIWVKKTPASGTLEHFIPRRRLAGDVPPWWTIYFSGRRVTMDTPHDATHDADA